MQKLKSVQGAEVAGKRVLLRMSLNVPLKDGKVENDFRLKQSLPTLKFLLERGAGVVVVGYLGREGASVEPVVAALAALLPGTKVRFSPTLEVGEVPGGECVVLENIRREAGEEQNDPALAQKLANLADLFVNDAFAEAHRAYASNVGVAKLLPAYAGLCMEQEVAKLSEALTPPPGSLAIIGGAKFETKQPLIEKLLSLYGEVLLGGALGNDVLKARGLPVGASLVSDLPVPVALAAEPRLLVAEDAVVGVGENNAERDLLINDIRKEERIIDIGHKTAALWSEKVLHAPFVLWNGPMGVYEQGYTRGTEALADALSRGSGKAVVGGGDTAAALEQFTFDPARVFVSTGGGAMLEYLAKGTLPALEVLHVD